MKELNVPVKKQKCLSKRAPDMWDSAAFTSIFLASAFSCSQAESTPAHTQVTQTIGVPEPQHALRFKEDFVNIT
jgi:hypothetical protein